EDQLVRVLEKNTELTIQNTDLQKQVQHLQNFQLHKILLFYDRTHFISLDEQNVQVNPGSTTTSNRSGDIESILKSEEKTISFLNELGDKLASGFLH
ncbi:hypothetical protein L9F63_017790, partial [Diploptera punctata]